MATCLIALGSNLGDRVVTLHRAIAAIDASPDIQVISCSRFHATSAIGGPPDQPEFLNAVLVADTSLEPGSLLALLHAIEKSFGRTRVERWAARTLDLDLLLYDQLVLRQPDLTLPHPRMAFRRFVLEPAVEVAAKMTDPRTGWTLSRLLAHLNETVPYIAIAGPNGGLKSDLAAEIADRLGGKAINTGITYNEKASGDLHQWIALADEAAAALTVDRLTAGTAWAVSDFWFGELLASTNLLLSLAQRAEPRATSGGPRKWAEDRSRRGSRNWQTSSMPESEAFRFAKHWGQLAGRTALPRIIVMLSSSQSFAQNDLARNRSTTEDFLTALQSVAVPQGPVLCVDAARRRQAIDEVVAAARATE